jgi:hypothetical protein
MFRRPTSSRTLQRRRARLELESLENRLVPATINFIPPGPFHPYGQLMITGTGATDNVSVRVDTQDNAVFGNLVVTDNGVDRVIYSSTISRIDKTQILFSDGGGSDTFINNSDLSAIMIASDNTADHYTGGSRNNQFVIEGSGGNHVFTGRGNVNMVVENVGASGQKTVLTDTTLTTSSLTSAGGGQRTSILADIQLVVINGGGHEVIDASAFSGSTILRGGGGGGTIYGGKGNDDITTAPGGGYTVFDAFGQNTFHTFSGDELFGLANRPLSDVELRQSGALMVSLQGDSLVFNGPSGGGFRIEGTWSTSQDSMKRLCFTATSTTLTLKTALGDVPLPNLPSAPLMIYTKTSGLANAGLFDHIAPGGLNLDLSAVTSPLSTLLNTFDLNLPTSGLHYGIALGGDLTASGPAHLDLPLDNALPYIYSSGSAGFSVEFGGLSVGAPGTALVLDPTDPAVFVKAGEFALGGSMTGYIPFKPLAMPSSLAASIQSNGGVAGYGNLYATGRFDLGEIPVTLSGTSVIGLDPRHTGAPLGLTDGIVHQIVSGQVKLDTIKSLNDMFIGFNGTVGLGYSKAGYYFRLNVDQCTAIAEPAISGSSIFAFRAETVDPYRDTPLEGILQPGGTVVTDGYLGIFPDSATNSHYDFHLDSTVGNSLLFGVLQSSVSLHLGNDGVGLEATASSPLGGGNIHLKGNIYSTGYVYITGGLDFNLDARVATVYCHADFKFEGNFNTYVSFGAHLTAGFQLDVWPARLSASIDANLAFGRDSNGIHISGSGTGRGTVHSDIGGGSFSVSVGVSFNDNGLTISLPNPFPNISAHW